MLSVLFIVLVACTSVVYGWFPATYPQYCSKDVDSKEIPALSANELTLVTELKQVQVMIRHGARTPYGLFSCWKDYDVVWNNCNVTELMMESPSYSSQQRPASWLFRKLYDGSANYLGGNCLTGQLLLEGYQQEEHNGIMLYNAYIEGALPLFTSNKWEDVYSSTGIYLRSDDEQRTLMSGQILMHTLFNVTEETIVPWHTGDYNLDQIYPNSNVCPRLDQIKATGYATPEWIAENTSQAITQLTADLDQIWGAGYWSWGTALDCMMTTVCTDREMPAGTAATPMTDAIFNATVAQSEYTWAFMALNNNSIWAKTAMGNIAWQMRNNLLNIVSGETSSAGSTQPLKFALFSAHDTSLMPFLAALLGDAWDGRWAGYAYLISMELYSASAASPLGANGYYFRLTYNAKVLRVPGCDADLCDLNVLLDRLAFGQESMPCSVPATPAVVVDDSCGDSDDAALSTTHWSLLVVLSLVVGALIGAAGVVFVEKRRALDGNNNVELSAPSSHPLHNTM